MSTELGCVSLSWAWPFWALVASDGLLVSLPCWGSQPGPAVGAVLGQPVCLPRDMQREKPRAAARVAYLSGEDWARSRSEVLGRHCPCTRLACVGASRPARAHCGSRGPGLTAPSQSSGGIGGCSGTRESCGDKSLASGSVLCRVKNWCGWDAGQEGSPSQPADDREPPKDSLSDLGRRLAPH